MKEEFKSLFNIKEIKEEKYNLDFLKSKVLRKVQSFHASFPIYRITPLVEMRNTAKELGIRQYLCER